jgi:hypothetical protein
MYIYIYRYNIYTCIYVYKSSGEISEEFEGFDGFDEEDAEGYI